MTAPAGPGTPLWQLLQSVAALLQEVDRGRSLSARLDHVPVARRPAVQALSFELMRQLGRARALVRRLAQRPPAPAVEALLATALALLSAEVPAYPEHTLVSQAVEAARRQKSTQAQSGFINACLRRFQRERTALMADVMQDPVARYNHPAWWIERLQQDHPAHWQDLLAAAQQAPPLTLRVNRQRSSVAQTLAQLQAMGLAAEPVGVDGLQLRQAVPVHALPGFDEGAVSVQDAAAQLAAPLLLQGLALDRPWRMLDACAAPGGKTGHLLEMAPQARVTALEIDPARTGRIEDNLHRLGLQAEVRTADAGRPADWWTGEPWDAILLDAPCTASGIVRRHPDIRWLRRPTDSAQLAQTQARLLDTLWPTLRTGGRMLYCTCSVFRAEGDEVIQAFLMRNKAARILQPVGHLIPSVMPSGLPVGDNRLGEHDGFYYALLEKSGP